MKYIGKEFLSLSELKVNIRRFFDRLGPGLLFASMAIGTSHLVLSTKAGAVYGPLMVIPIVLANLLKFPFFEFGVRFTHATQKSLTEGYAAHSSWFLYLYASVNLVSAFTILAALYSVTSGMTVNVFNEFIPSTNTATLLLFTVISILLIAGRYKLLEQSLKYIVLILLIALIATVILVTANHKVASTAAFTPPDWFNAASVLFIISLVGWMPTAVEASGWVSLWNLEKIKQSPEKITVQSALKEFNFGYFLTAFMAVLFFYIGYMTLYESGVILSDNSVQFAAELTGIFTTELGTWAQILISIAALAAMFSTCLSAHDALARVLVDLLQRLGITQKNPFALAVLFLALSNFVVIAFFSTSMGALIAVATFASFVFAPLIGYMNHVLIFSDQTPLIHRPPTILKLLSIVGIIFLGAFALYYLYLVIAT
jgi:Mn2+/Fe2+ NRAMP family transporter